MQISPLVEQLIEGLQSRERLDLEFKACRDSLSQDLWETVSAFANTQGGWLLLGVNDKGVPLGVTNPEKRVIELFNLGRNSQKISNERLRNLIPMHPSDATKVLTGLRDRGLLRKASDRRGAFYVLPVVATPRLDIPSLFDDVDVPRPLAVVNKGLVKDEVNLRAEEQNLRVEEEFLREIQTNLRVIARRVERRKFIEESIVKLCSIRPYSTSELAKIFEMSPTNMVTQYLKGLEKSNKLIWTGKTLTDRTGKYRASMKV